MKILYSWLKELVPTRLAPAEAARILTSAGIEVSSCRYLGAGLEGVVTARILEMGPHPNADRLSLCRVSDGTREYRIVCGARNMKAGDAVALARVGARLPNGAEIRPVRIRGEVSEGMLCSEAELGLSEEAAGIMILPGETEAGEPLAAAVGLDDWLLEVEVTPNRGDCLSVLGIARELAAAAAEPLVLPETPYPEAGPEAGTLASVSVSDPDLCPRYSALVACDVVVAPSPLWMQRRLTLCGIRPINNVVDVTNYVLLELGQPMHAFDLDRLRGGRIDVRRSGQARRFRTLDGVERAIEPEMLLIWDAAGPVAVAGVMGGENSEVTPATRRVLFESAHFAPLSIRRTSKRLGLASESSYRFERGVDPGGTLRAARRAMALLAAQGPVTAARGVIDVGGERAFDRVISFRPGRASLVIGREYQAAGCRETFEALGFRVAQGEQGTLLVTVPSHRFDVTREIDLVEEVARFRGGYDAVPETYPRAGLPQPSADDRFQEALERAASHLQAHGFSQAVNFSFASEREWTRLGDLLGFDPQDAVRLKNPISEETAMMRPSLLMGLLHAVGRNLRRFVPEVRLFEAGKAFGRHLEPTLFEEPRLAFAACGSRLPGGWSGNAPLDFYDIKGVAESLLAILGAGPVHFVPTASFPFLAEGRAAQILRSGETIGWLGAVRRELLEAIDIGDPVYYCELRIGFVLSAGDAPALFRETPRFPPVSRDYSCLFPEAVPVGDVLATVKALAPEVASATVFDVYTGRGVPPGRKSVAFRVRLQAADRTLTEAEVDSIHTKVLKLLENRFGGVIRTKGGGTAGTPESEAT